MRAQREPFCRVGDPADKRLGKTGKTDMAQARLQPMISSAMGLRLIPKVRMDSVVPIYLPACNSLACGVLWCVRCLWRRSGFYIWQCGEGWYKCCGKAGIGTDKVHALGGFEVDCLAQHAFILHPFVRSTCLPIPFG